MNCMLTGQERMPKAMMRLKIGVTLALHVLLLRCTTSWNTRHFQTFLSGTQENKEYKQGITFIHKKKLLPCRGD